MRYHIIRVGLDSTAIWQLSATIQYMLYEFDNRIAELSVTLTTKIAVAVEPRDGRANICVMNTI